MPTPTHSAPGRTGRRPRHLVVLLLVGALVACTASSGYQRPASARPAAPRDFRALTRAELSLPSMMSAGTLYDALSQARPLWLNNRGPHSFLNNVGVQVALDGQLLGGLAALRLLRPSEIETARILEAPDAAIHYGIRAQSQRVIDLTSRRGVSR